ncbi:hypothetical protein MJT46_001862 [Ovis ammon polii x Ovis aries]|nr:hypothetical protein MJT46_001862 [Ovis ammon polii x Ovis aries]
MQSRTESTQGSQTCTESGVNASPLSPQEQASGRDKGGPAKGAQQRAHLLRVVTRMRTGSGLRREELDTAAECGGAWSTSNSQGMLTQSSARLCDPQTPRPAVLRKTPHSQMLDCWLELVQPGDGGTGPEPHPCLDAGPARKGATAVQIQRSKGDVESKAGRGRGLYTLVITDKEKAETLTRSLPPASAEKELK